METTIDCAIKNRSACSDLLLAALGPTGAIIEWKIKEIYGEEIFQQMINRWRTIFLDGHTDLNYSVSAGRTSVIDKDVINTVR